MVSLGLGHLDCPKNLAVAHGMKTSLISFKNEHYWNEKMLEMGLHLFPVSSIS
jgi:hypothetical protein